MNKKNSFALIIILLFCLSVFGFLTTRNKSSDLHTADKIRQIKIAGSILNVDLALSQAEQEQGLSGRSGLKKDEGMLFFFNQPGKYPFWMKDMNFAIDMIWIGEDMNVIYIKNDALPASFPATFGPVSDTKYVLEVSAGFSQKNNLKIGDKVELIY